jgi:dipeptide/tripeptide permease
LDKTLNGVLRQKTRAVLCRIQTLALKVDLIEDPKIAWTVFGVVVLGGNLFGLLAPILTGDIVRATGSFNGAFAVSGALSLIGASISFLFTRRPITICVQTGIGESVLRRVV